MTWEMSWRYASDTRIHSCKTYFFAACSRAAADVPSLPPYALLLHNTNDSRNKKTPLAQITYYNNYNVSPRTNSIAFLIQGFDVMLYKVYLMLKKPNGKEKSPKTGFGTKWDSGRSKPGTLEHYKLPFVRLRKFFWRFTAVWFSKNWGLNLTGVEILGNSERISPGPIRSEVGRPEVSHSPPGRPTS